MSSVLNFTKDPQADLDYTLSWADWLAVVEDTIASTQWFIPDGLQLGQGGGGNFTPTTATVWLKGGTDGHRYRITSRITTTNGRTDERSFFITIRQR